MRDEPPPVDAELFDLPLDEEVLPLLLFEPPELFDEPDRPPLDDLDELLAFRPDEDDEDDFERPDELVDRPPELDFDRLPPFERDAELLPLGDRPPVREPDERPPPDVVIVSAAAPIAPMAAPDAAPVSISPATSITLSTIADVVVFEPEDLPRDEVDEDELFFRELLELDLLAINFPPNDRNKKLNCV